MFDFSWSEHTIGNVLYCTILYALFVALYYGRYVNKALLQEGKTNYTLMFGALLLIITACIDTDWFHYRDMVREYDLSIGALNYGEPVYRGIVKLIGKNYLLFRVVVWGSAFVMAVTAFRRFNINLNTAVFFLIAVFLIKFNYGRATLGMASYYLGLSFLLIPLKQRRFLGFLLAAVFLWGAYEFHHSMLLLIVLTPMVFIPIDRPFIAVIVLLALPFIASFVNESLFLIDRLENEYISNKMDNYLELEGGMANIFGIIQSVISYGAFIAPIIIDTVAISKNRKMIHTPILKIYRIAISAAVIAVSFILLNLDSSLFVYRILYMSFIPLTIITVYLYEHHFLSRNNYKFIVLWGISAISFVLLHLVYVYR